MVIIKKGEYYLAFPDDETDIISKLGADKYSFIETKKTVSGDGDDGDGNDNGDDGNDNGDGDGGGEDKVRYLAYPEDYVRKMLGKLDIDIQPLDGNDYVGVKYKDIENAGHMKRYLTNDHIVFAGCATPVKVGDHGLRCDSKEIYMSLHPLDEWTDHHVIYRN